MKILHFVMALSLLLVGCEKSSSLASQGEAAADSAKSPEQDGSKEGIPEISVEKAAQALQAGAVAIDANSKSTREKMGTVPDAVILSSSSSYELTQLPSDKSKDLIFYCSNTFCTASDAAAERASEAGYEKVHVMREGIKGWKAAGKPTEAYPRS
jgi:rhodanese-related sulfurtransferase